jgi:hypothetical protein
MACVAFMLAVVNASFPGFALAVEVLVYYSNYAIGVSLVLLGGYFLWRARCSDDGMPSTSSTCACHGQIGYGDTESCEDQVQVVAVAPGFEKRQAGSTLLGFVQGLACPGGLVGMAFLTQQAGSIFGLLIFVCAFFLATSLAMGAFAMSYGVLTRRCASSEVLARPIHIASCFITVVLGLAWILLNATGKLNAVFGHSHEHGHSHMMYEHEHGHTHMHAVMMFLSAVRWP